VRNAPVFALLRRGKECGVRNGKISQPRMDTDGHGFLSANFANYRELFPMNYNSWKFAQFADSFVFHPWLNCVL
jgi:hypothetical protein